MPYPSGAKSHHEGVKNEHTTITILNKLKIYQHPVIHVGGTKTKIDALSGTKKISIKLKTNMSRGSFDWGNLSCYNPIFDEFYANAKKYRILEEEERIALVEPTRNQFSELCNQALEEFDVEFLIKAIKDTFDKQIGYDAIVNDAKCKNFHIFDPTEHQAYQLILSGHNPKLFNARNAKCSRKVVFQLNTETIDTGLRLRVTTNNGITALLGLSKANSHTYGSVKLQQDSILRFFKKVNPKVHSYSHIKL
jgi:hypothetical protein